MGGWGEREEGGQLCKRGIKRKTKTSSKDLQLCADLRQPRRASGPKTVTKEWRKILQMVNTVPKYRDQGVLYFQNTIGFHGTSVNIVLLEHIKKYSLQLADLTKTNCKTLSVYLLQRIATSSVHIGGYYKSNFRNVPNKSTALSVPIGTKLKF